MQDKELRVRWLMFDIPQLVALGVVLSTGIAGYATLKADVANFREQYNDRVMRTDHRFNSIERSQDETADKLEPLSTVVHRVTSTEQQLVATNQRLDRFIELLSSNIELIRKDINNLTIEVRVLAQEVKSQNGPTKDGRAVR